MKKIVAATPDFIVDFGSTDTANYAEEDIVVMVKETVQNLYLPPQSKIKGNPTIFIYADSVLPTNFTIHFTEGDYLPVNATMSNPEGKAPAFPLAFNVDGGLGFRNLQLRPVINGTWIISFF